MEKGTLLRRVREGKLFRVAGKTALWGDYVLKAEKGAETDLVYLLGGTDQAQSVLLEGRYQIVSETLDPKPLLS